MCNEKYQKRYLWILLEILIQFYFSFLNTFRSILFMKIVSFSEAPSFPTNYKCQLNKKVDTIFLTQRMRNKYIFSNRSLCSIILQK